MSFYRGQLSDASERHRRWAAEHYAAVAERRAGSFWAERAKNRDPAKARPPIAPADARTMAAMPVELSPEAAFVETPCLGEDFVGVVRGRQSPGPFGSGRLSRGRRPHAAAAESSRRPHAARNRARMDGSDAARIRPRHRRLARQSRRPGEVRGRRMRLGIPAQPMALGGEKPYMASRSSARSPCSRRDQVI